LGFKNKEGDNAIICMSSDPLSKTLCAVTGNGATLMLRIRKTKEWECVIDLGFD
jgi:microcystin degradation protein MlrC